MPTCALCKKKDDEPEEYGEFMKKSGICSHYYCLLLATNLPQKGADHSGILGFLVRDIRKEIKNCATRTCRYCNKSHATIACYTCKKYFHQICGNESGCVSEFINQFHSFCHEHVPFKDEPMLPGMASDCWICKEPIGQYSPTRTLRAYCCQNGYVHRRCMRKYALSAGYYLRCLWCGKKDFRDDIRKHGVFVPDREARWDNNETVRYADLHCGYSRCDAKICLCPQGREFFRNKWKLKICNGCGASGVHDKCAGEKLFRGQYTCSFCANVLNKTTAAEESRKNNNYAFNYTLFMSKTYEDVDPLPENQPVVAPPPPLPEKVEGPTVASAASVSPAPTTKSTPPVLKKELVMKEMYLFNNNFEIQGTARVKVDDSQPQPDKLSMSTTDVVGFLNADRLIQEIFEEILAEGRTLSTDMVDEVMRRIKQYLEVFGDVVDC